MKSELVSKAVEILQDAGFEVSDCSGARSCFDIIAKREEILLIKILTNIEGLTKYTSMELKDISDLVSGVPLVIGYSMKTARLSNGVVYGRYGIRIVNLDTFEDILNNRVPLVYSVRGNYCVNINSELLVQLRRKLGMTQEKLAVEIHVSKQSIYRYESSGSISIEIAERLMELLDRNIAIPNKPILERGNYKKSNRKMHRNLTNLEMIVMEDLENIGFSTLPTNAPFDIFAREKAEGGMLFTVVSNDGKRLGYRIELINAISELLGGYKICISERRDDNADVLVIKPKKLNEIQDSRELIDMIENF